MGESTETTDWSLTNGHGYILNRDRAHAAASRLNLQFYLWKDALGFNIHPVVAAELRPDARIAEAPPTAWLPAGTSLRRWNVLEDVPDDLVGTFDYVHTRLLVLVVENKDPRPILRNLLRLLKPGGYLQWDELDTVHMAVHKIDTALATPALDQLRAWSWAGGRRDWTVRLAEFMADVGFSAAKTDFYGDPLPLVRAFNEQHLLTADEFALGLAKLGQADAANKYFKLVEDAYVESVVGASLSVPRVVCTAQKPVER
ncbi:umta methyltransferase family protein [Grosmannia clavigera kw1407]|uniref:Umta methyltransferase family protein n=1 Tax=Grosmannia clavigera (strain kw1407 / UAMH 11150) TaxID=655863 RepID=F0XI85_GROCL|nr:umta methyltransferase family protein [Grosmannia clavigera kw1407]EFX02850.1 umta methyltransferase family protein [Grosmannia clavigera kw1407]